MSENQNQVTDEQLEEQVSELSKKETRTPEEEETLGSLKTEKTTRYEKRMDRMKWEKKNAEEENVKLRDENEKLKTPPVKEPEPVKIIEETVKAGEKVFKTDAALESEYKAGHITYAEATAHQQAREREIAKSEMREEIKQERQMEKQQEVRSEDTKAVLVQYPHFARKLEDGSLNPNFNPEDPLYKEANDLYNAGLSANPKGLSIAINKAKKILGITGDKPDVSHHMNLTPSSAPPIGSKKPDAKNVPFTAEEEESAIRMYTKGDSINSKTGRSYTPSEAIAKAKQAKVDQIERRENR